MNRRRMKGIDRNDFIGGLYQAFGPNERRDIFR
jgi:hypothetical protein